MHFGGPGGFGGPGVHFVNLGGRGGGIDLTEAFKLPEPLGTIFKLITTHVPAPILGAAVVLFISFTFTWIMALLMRNSQIVFFLMFFGSRTPFSSQLWLLFFGAGILGYI